MKNSYIIRYTWETRGGGGKGVQKTDTSSTYADICDVSCFLFVLLDCLLSFSGVLGKVAPDDMDGYR